jgi:hypothetical protein
MSQLELRILTSLAVYNKRVLKNCDIKQAIVQSNLPEDEVYFFETSSRLSSLGVLFVHCMAYAEHLNYGLINYALT